MNELKRALAKLPAPKNDYEIVLPDDAKPAEEMDEDKYSEQYQVMDESDVQALRRAQAEQRCTYPRFGSWH